LTQKETESNGCGIPLAAIESYSRPNEYSTHIYIGVYNR